ncbi:MAG: hypothetical protein WCY12_05850, partial [Candidatus Omnitrophota bacterium]
LALPYEKKWLTRKDISQLTEDFRQFCVGLGYPIEQVDIATEIISDKLQVTINVSGAEINSSGENKQ